MAYSTSLLYVFCQSYLSAQTALALEIPGAEISSDYELAKVLVYVCEQSPYKANLVKDVKHALASISSESDKLKVYEVL